MARERSRNNYDHKEHKDLLLLLLPPLLSCAALARHAAATALAQQHPKPQSAAESARQGADGSNSTVLQAGLVARTGSSRKLLQTNQFGYFIPADVCTAQLTLSGVVFYCIAPPQQLPAIVVIQRRECCLGRQREARAEPAQGGGGPHRLRPGRRVKAPPA